MPDEPGCCTLCRKMVINLNRKVQLISQAAVNTPKHLFVQRATSPTILLISDLSVIHHVY